MLEGAEYSSMTMDKADETKPETAKKEPLAKTITKQLVGILLAGGLLYLSFKDADFNKLWHYAQEADLRFFIAVAFSGILSHLLRAWRWVILLQPLSSKKISLFNSFCAVMYGYAVNIVVPRGGEVARLVSISKTESIPWAGVLPTMFIDRLLDLAMLVLLLGLTLTKLPEGILDERLTGPLGLVMCIATAGGLIALPFVGKFGRMLLEFEPIKKSVPEAIARKLNVLLLQFDNGTLSLKSAPKLFIIALSSLAIWACYWANMYLMLFAFHLEKACDFAKSLVLFTISSVGVLVPTPGSVGSYHFLTSQTLQKIAGVDEAQSLAYAAVTHLICFIAVTCLPAAICFVIQSSAQKSKK